MSEPKRPVPLLATEGSPEAATDGGISLLLSSILLATRPREPEEDSRVFVALGSSARIRILSAIAVREKTISELSRELGVNRITLRYHLGLLREHGLVEEVAHSGTRRVGRPAVLYRLSKRVHVPGFPQRHFDLLGQMALEALREAIGDDAASSRLQEKGRAIGMSMINEVKARVRFGEWTPETFERLVLNGLFRDFGVPSEVLSRSADAIEFRSFNCPFLELAERMPDIVCDALDRGFHDGIDEALGDVRTDRLACMGYGEPYCQYRVTWGRRSKLRAPSHREGRERGKTAVKERARRGRTV